MGSFGLRSFEQRANACIITDAHLEKEEFIPTDNSSVDVFSDEDIDLPPPVALHRLIISGTELTNIVPLRSSSRHRRSDTESLIEGSSLGESKILTSGTMALSDQSSVTSSQRSNSRVVRRSTPEKLLEESGFL